MATNGRPSTVTNTPNATASSSSYQFVIHKKTNGTLILNESALSFYPAASTSTPIKFPWTTIAKHQVSPISHPRNLLKVILHPSDKHSSPGANGSDNGNGNGNGSSSPRSTSQTYEFKTRSDLDRIRKDISTRLVTSRRIEAQNAEPSNRKRKIDAIGMSISSSSSSGVNATPASSANANAARNEYSFTSFTQSEQIVTRSSVLASDRNLRTQRNLLTHSGTVGSGDASDALVTEDGFWSTHDKKAASQAAKIHGIKSKGLSSAMKSSLDIQITGNVTKRLELGVEEMRQIFIMYPAVHAAYEEKVPLELSEEQFWRKYLESEYFHRDRGRLGMSAKKVVNEMEKEKIGMQGEDDKDGVTRSDADKKSAAKEEESKAAREREESARMGAASSNDIFSRKEIELQKMRGGDLVAMGGNQKYSLHNIAVGQFDLLSTANTERGSKLLMGSNDLHPSDDRGKKVIEKYNKHWAMVLNPEEATAGCDLKTLARRSAHHALEGDDDAKASGGLTKEMFRLVGYANADEDHADHVKCVGETSNGKSSGSDEVLFRELTLKNIDAYAGKQLQSGPGHGSRPDLSKCKMLENVAMNEVKSIVEPIIERKPIQKVKDAFPEPVFGKQLLTALTKRMLRDARTDNDMAKMTRALPLEFRKNLTSYARRSSELLRHFFALRRVIEQEKKTNHGSSKSSSSQKLKKIVKGMEAVYKEMEITSKELPVTERKMYLSVMNQLDWAFKLNRDSGGGFNVVQD